MSEGMPTTRRGRIIALEDELERLRYRRRLELARQGRLQVVGEDDS